MTSIGERLALARRRRFVGRTGEVELFREALVAPEPPFSVLFVHGPGGVGKTTLLRRFAEVAAEHEVPAVYVDARTVDPSPPAFAAALGEAVALADDEALFDELGAGRRVVMVDTYERASDLDRWMREDFVPALPAEVIVVLAGRRPPDPEWRADPGWHELLRVVSLRNLRPEESTEYLAVEGLDEPQREPVLRLTHGHPLALSLYVDVLAQRGEEAPAVTDAGPMAPTHVPDVVTALVERFVEGVPTDRQRAALAITARVRYTDEAMLAAVLGGDDAPALLDWLRGLSFIEQAPRGVFPHDLAREVLDADLRWRDRPLFEDLHFRARRHVLERVRTCDGREQHLAAGDLAFLHRINPVMSAFMDWTALAHLWGEPPAPSDTGALLAMVERYEGGEQAEIAERWLARQPERFVVVRGPGREPLGFSAVLYLHHADPADVAADPGTLAAWEYAHRNGPPRPGEAVTMCRFFVDRDRYQDAPSPTWNVVSAAHLQHIFNTPSPCWDFIGGVSDPAAVESMFSYIFFDRAPAADYEVGGRRYATFAHDWRRMGVEEWLDATGRQEISEEPPPPRASAAAPMVALSQPEFAAAVRSALRDLHRPELLARNPLLRSRAVRDRGGDDAGPAHLRDLLLEGAERLRSHPRDEKLYRVLDRTYLRPAPTQEAAMEILDLPPSTYRRHLTQGVGRVVEWLWQRDLYGAA